MPRLRRATSELRRQVRPQVLHAAEGRAYSTLARPSVVALKPARVKIRPVPTQPWPQRPSAQSRSASHRTRLRRLARDLPRTGPASPGVAFQPGAFFLLFSATPPRFRVQAQAAPMASGRGVSLQRKRFITVEGRLPSVIQCWIGDAR